MAPEAISGSWKQETVDVDGCSKFKVQRVEYQVRCFPCCVHTSGSTHFTRMPRAITALAMASAALKQFTEIKPACALRLQLLLRPPASFACPWKLYGIATLAAISYLKRWDEAGLTST